MGKENKKPSRWIKIIKRHSWHDVARFRSCISAAKCSCVTAQVRSMILPHWLTLFHLLPCYLGSITSSDNKAVKQSYHCTPIVRTLSHLPSIHLSLRFLPGRLESGSLPSYPGSPCSSHAQLSFETNSWACVLACQLGSYLVFSVSAGVSSLGGVLFAWEHKGSLRAGPLHTTYTVYVTALSICCH